MENRTFILIQYKDGTVRPKYIDEMTEAERLEYKALPDILITDAGFRRIEEDSK